MKHKLLFFMAFFLPCLVFAQGNVSVKGSVIGAVSNDPIPGVIVTVTELNRYSRCNCDGDRTESPSHNRRGRKLHHPKYSAGNLRHSA